LHHLHREHFRVQSGLSAQSWNRWQPLREAQRFATLPTAPLRLPTRRWRISLETVVCAFPTALAMLFSDAFPLEHVPDLQTLRVRDVFAHGGPPCCLCRAGLRGGDWRIIERVSQSKRTLPLGEIPASRLQARPRLMAQ